MKKSAKISILLVIFCLQLIVPVNAQSSEPTNWAKDDVTQAIEKGLVYDNASENYQKPIRRYEYVLLALKVFEKSGMSIKIVQQYPFSDITGNAYESDIVKAFNAGIINGYTNGTFKPNQEITRQEIAALVVNLVKVLDPAIDTKVTGNNFSDAKIISKWAKPYIDYCYKNDIMKGVGKDSVGLDKMDPLGHATVEQAIVLLYRLATDKGLLKTYNLGQVDVLNDAGDSYVKSSVINQFAEVYGEKLALVVKDLSEKDQIDIVLLEQTSIDLSFNNIGRVSISKIGSLVNLNLMASDLNNPLIMDAFYRIAETFKDTEQLKIAVNRSVSGLTNDKTFVFSQSINQNDYFKAFSDQVAPTTGGSTNPTWYAIQYQISLNAN